MDFRTNKAWKKIANLVVAIYMAVFPLRREAACTIHGLIA